jgi:hypothetical protein
MRIFKSGNDERRWSRRLIDDETHDFFEHVLEETSEIFRTASGEFQLRSLCLDVFAGAHTTDLRWLKSRGVAGEEFYRRELAPNWEALDQAQRARKIDQFIELSHMLGETGEDGQPTESLMDVVATVHVKVLLLAWAYDRTYSYVDRLFNGPLQYRTHRYRLAGGRLRGLGTKRSRADSNGGPPMEQTD